MSLAVLILALIGIAIHVLLISSAVTHVIVPIAFIDTTIPVSHDTLALTNQLV
jgi:hypothetical protein